MLDSVKELGFPNSFTNSNVDIVIDVEFKVEALLPSILSKIQPRNSFRGWIQLRNNFGESADP